MATTSTPGSAARMTREAVYVKRFSRTERALHWIHASAFLVLLGTGLVLYVPRLSALVARRPLVKDIHVYTAVAWIALLAIVVALGDRRGLRRTLRDLDLFDDDDRSGFVGNRRPQGRFNAGQKLHAALVAGFASLFAVSGLPALARRAGHSLPLGEHDPPPRRADVRVARAAAGPPLPGADPPSDPPRPARDHGRLGAPGLGARAPPKVDRA